MKKAKSGFTLIEILVVIAIISILASIAFPVFSKARAKGRQTSCLSNIKQLTMAILMYADDYDETLPPSVQRQNEVDPITDDSYIWSAAIMSYVTNKTIYNCMEARGQSYYVGTWGDRGRLSIGLNSGLEMGQGLMPFSLGAFSDPTATIMLADSTVGSTGAPDNARGFQIKADCKPDTQSGISSRHNGGANIGFLDGHAKWYNSGRVWQSNNRAGLHWTP